MKEIIFLILGFLIVIKGADFLVTGATALARRMKVSNLVIGLTVVAFGTSTPELFVNLFASLEGNAEIAIGNVVGSNIFNVLAILGISSMIYPLSVSKGTIWKEIPFSLAAAVVAGVMANDIVFDRAAHSVLSRIDGFVLIVFFVIFMYYILSVAKAEEGEEEELKISLQKSLWMVVGGLTVLVTGGKFIVDNAVIVAGRLGVHQSVIGLTIVAAGTSLPEKKIFKKAVLIDYFQPGAWVIGFSCHFKRIANERSSVVSRRSNENGHFGGIIGPEGIKNLKDIQ